MKYCRGKARKGGWRESIQRVTAVTVSGLSRVWTGSYDVQSCLLAPAFCGQRSLLRFQLQALLLLHIDRLHLEFPLCGGLDTESILLRTHFRRNSSSGAIISKNI